MKQDNRGMMTAIVVPTFIDAWKIKLKGLKKSNVDVYVYIHI